MVDETNEHNDDDDVKPVRIHKTVDKLLLLDSGSIIIGRVIIQKEDPSFIHVFRPCIIIIDENGTMHMGRWIPESRDEIFIIPATKVMNVSNPQVKVNAAYVKEFISEEEGTQTADATMVDSTQLNEPAEGNEENQTGKVDKAKLH